MEAAYNEARSAEATVLLTGGYGDHLYSGGERWLTESLSERRFRLVARELGALAYRGGWRALSSDRGVRHAGGQLLRRRRRSPPTPWLTRRATALLAGEPDLPLGLETAPRRNQALSVCGLFAADGTAAETFHTSRHGIELRHPYRDRRVIELALGLPADQLYRPNRTKAVLRTAMVGLLPEIVRERSRPTSLLPFFQRGLVERESSTLHQLIGNARQLWEPFVEARRLRELVASTLPGPHDGRAMLIPWYCGFAGLWIQQTKQTQHPARENCA
jgi:asparagine synthase (glutamine-hydrolysing)